MESEIFIKFNQLQKKIEQLVAENFEYNQKVSNFEQILISNAEKVSLLQDEIKILKVENEQLKLGKAFVGSEDNNDEAKKKIDNLVKEINLCISTLKE